VGRAAGAGRRTPPEARRLNDILAGQAADPATLAELYDLEHDAIDEDLAFHRAWARRVAGPTVDLGCGSGRLFRSLLDGGATRIVGVDGSSALLARAEARIADDERLRTAAASGRISLQVADVRSVRLEERFGLAILAGVLAHLDGPEAAVRALTCTRRLLAPEGLVLIDLLGPGALPVRDLPLSVDWERTVATRRVIRRSQLRRHEAPEGLRVTYATLTDLVEADGTIARVPASFRLWYPSPSAVVALADEADLVVEAAFGSYASGPLDERSERCIFVLRARSSMQTRGEG
jgi:SAM-dependent methyltransferase